MMNVKITVMRKARYDDLIEKYENPIEHACDLKEGQVFICEGWQKPEGFCDSAWESVCDDPCARGRKFLRRLDEKREIRDDLLQRRFQTRQFSDRGM